MDFKILMKFYYIRNTFDLQFFDNEMTVVLNSFEICTEKRFVSLFFLKEKDYNLTFNDTCKMYCCAICLSKFKLDKQAVLKL